MMRTARPEGGAAPSIVPPRSPQIFVSSVNMRYASKVSVINVLEMSIYKR